MAADTRELSNHRAGEGTSAEEAPVETPDETTAETTDETTAETTDETTAAGEPGPARGEGEAAGEAVEKAAGETASRAAGKAGGTAANNSASKAVRIHGLERSFGGRKILDGLELDIRAGEFVALLGRSGSGKSTLLRALAALDHNVAGKGLLSAPANVSVVFQDARLLPWKRVLDNVLLGLSGPGAREQARAALAEVGLSDRESAWSVELSGGEQQRVSLARSLVREPELLLADEPFGALDALTRIRMHKLLRKLCEAHRPAVLLVTHDVDEAIELADRVAVLEDGRITADVRVELDGPRAHGTREYAALRESLLARLGVDAERTGDGPDGPGLPDGPAGGPGPAGQHSDVNADGHADGYADRPTQDGENGQDQAKAQREEQAREPENEQDRAKTQDREKEEVSV